MFQVQGAPAVGVPCNGGARLTPGVAGVPDLPWHLVLRRSADGTVVLDEEVTELPRWFVQIGDEVIGGTLNRLPVEGPAWPACFG